MWFPEHGSNLWKTWRLLWFEGHWRWHRGRMFRVAVGLRNGWPGVNEESPRKPIRVVLWKLLTDWTMNLTKRMKVKKWKDLAWFVGELKQRINFSCDILREDKVNIKKARTEKVTETEDEATRALEREQIITYFFLWHCRGNFSRIKWQHWSQEERRDGDNAGNLLRSCAAWMQKIIFFPTTIKQDRHAR